MVAPGVTLQYCVELILLLVAMALAERCYDCDSRHHKGCGEFFSGSAFVKDCDVRALLDPEEDRCVKMRKVGSDAIVRSCVKQGSSATAIAEGGCSLDSDNNILTCVCSGYLCNAIPPTVDSWSAGWSALFGSVVLWLGFP